MVGLPLGSNKRSRLMSLNRHQHSSISDQLEQQVAGFASMVTLMLRLGETNTLKECAVVLANELQEIIPYDMAYFWIETKTVIGHKVEIIASNDVSQVESNSLLGYMLQPGLKALKRQVMEQANPLAIEAYSADEFFNAELESEQIHSVGFIKSELLSIPCALDLNKKRVVAGAFFMRSESWTLQEKAIINELQPYLLGVIDRHLHTKRKKEFPFFKTALASVVSAALLFIPVPLSVLAPAEIIPSDSQVMRSALTGVITEIHIKDNQHVKAGDVLVTFDDSELQTRYQVALQSLRIAQENWRQAQQAAFQDRDAKAQLPLLQLNVKKQNLQVEYLQQQLAKTTLVAPRDGVALIENSQQLLGKHVSIGESLFQIAVSSGVDIKGYLSVQDNVDFSVGNRVYFYPAATPEQALQGHLTQVHYYAEMHDGQYVFPIKASFADDTHLPAIGQRGMVKVLGEKVSLGYYLFRKPISSLRQRLGV